MNLREQLRKTRIDKGLTLHEVAERVGRSHSVVSRWELGTARMPDWDTVIDWARAVGLELQFRLESSEDPFTALKAVMSEEEARRLLLALEVVKKPS